MVDIAVYDKINRANNDSNKILVALGKHLRKDHKLARSTVAKRLGVTEKWVKWHVDGEWS